MFVKLRVLSAPFLSAALLLPCQELISSKYHGMGAADRVASNCHAAQGRCSYEHPNIGRGWHGRSMTSRALLFPLSRTTYGRAPTFGGSTGAHWYRLPVYIMKGKSLKVAASPDHQLTYLIPRQQIIKTYHQDIMHLSTISAMGVAILAGTTAALQVNWYWPLNKPIHLTLAY